MPLIPRIKGGQALFTSSRMPQTQMVLPSPEPLARIMASYGAGGKQGQTTDKYDLDFDAFPNQKRGLEQQIMMHELAEKAVKQEGYKRLTKEYNGNHIAFLEGERKKGKNGYEALRMQLRMGETQIRTNIQILKDNYKLQGADKEEARKNKAFEDYVRDPQTGQQVLISDEDGNVIGYSKVGSYLDTNYEFLDFDAQGNAMKYQSIDTQKAGLWNEFIRKQAALAKGSGIKTKEIEGLFETKNGKLVYNPDGSIKLRHSGDNLFPYLVWFDVAKSSNAPQLASVMKSAMKYMGREVEMDMNQEWWKFKGTQGYLTLEEELIANKKTDGKTGKVTDGEIKYSWMIRRIQSLIGGAVQESHLVTPHKWEMGDDVFGGKRSYSQMAVLGLVDGTQGARVVKTGIKNYVKTRQEGPSSFYRDYAPPVQDYKVLSTEFYNKAKSGNGVHPLYQGEDTVKKWVVKEDNEGNKYVTFEPTTERYFMTENGAYNYMADLPNDAVIIGMGERILSRPSPIPMLIDNQRTLLPYGNDVMEDYFTVNGIDDTDDRGSFHKEFAKPVWFVKARIAFPSSSSKEIRKNLKDFIFEGPEKKRLTFNSMSKDVIGTIKTDKGEMLILDIYIPKSSEYLMSAGSTVFSSQATEFGERSYEQKTQSVGQNDDFAFEYSMISEDEE